MPGSMGRQAPAWMLTTSRTPVLRRVLTLCTSGYVQSERAAARCVCEKSRHDGETVTSPFLTTPFEAAVSPSSLSYRARPDDTTTASRAALLHEQNFSTVRKRRTVTPMCLLAQPHPPPYLHSRGTIVSHSSQGGVRFPTGGKAATPSPRALRASEGQQIRCDSGADGIVRMKENGTNAGFPRLHAFCVRRVAGETSRNPEETGYGKDFT